MHKSVPNQLTVGRLGLAASVFILLGLYDLPPAEAAWMLNVGFAAFIVAGITDILDGCLARKFYATSAFGRIFDTFVDKVLILGAYIMLTGGNFVMNDSASGFERELPVWLTGGMASGVQTWMVVAMLVRELAVSGLRGFSESQGKVFTATVWGKLKMLTQVVAICTVMYQLANVPDAAWAVVVKLATVWTSVIVTVLTGVPYIGRARRLIAEAE
jgi:phosphatidylglycerophosphate synthase